MVGLSIGRIGVNIKGLYYVFLYVSDLERSKRFYGEQLGWHKRTDESDVAGYSFGDAYLVIHTDNRSQGKGQYGGGAWVAVKVDDLDGWHAKLREQGVKRGEVLDQPWGERQFYFEDPDGYHWSYGEPR